jgi:hypothetical protein
MVVVPSTTPVPGEITCARCVRIIHQRPQLVNLIIAGDRLSDVEDKSHETP